MSETGAQAASQAVDRKELLAQQFEEVEQAAKTQETSTHTASTTSGEGRVRDETGKFVKKPDEKMQAAATTEQQVTTAQEQPWSKAPDSWKKEVREGWTKLDPAYQQYIHEREQQMRAGVEPLLPKAELADKINKAAEPYINTIRGLGLDLPQAVAGLMKVDHDLRTLPHEQKLAVLHQVAMGYGIDLTGQMQHARQAYDPNFQAIQNELLNIKGQFSSLTQAQQAAQERSALEEIQNFRQTAEHFEDVKPAMIQLLQGGLADSIQEAYDKAIRLSPEIFDRINSAKQAAADAEKRKAADEAAKKAKAAAVSVKSATPGTKTNTNAQDRRSMLREQLDGLSERL